MMGSYYTVAYNTIAHDTRSEDVRRHKPHERQHDARELTSEQAEAITAWLAHPSQVWKVGNCVRQASSPSPSK